MQNFISKCIGHISYFSIRWSLLCIFFYGKGVKAEGIPLQLWLPGLPKSRQHDQPPLQQIALLALQVTKIKSDNMKVRREVWDCAGEDASVVGKVKIHGMFV